MQGQALPTGTQMETFEINTILGVGGFGITYKAWDHRLQRQVAVKEYLPTDLAVRGDDSVSVFPRDTERKHPYDYGLKRFLDEARTLARFNHPNIVRVLHFLEANGTAYMVMDFEQGHPLATHLKKLGAPMSEGAIKALARPLLDGLKTVHTESFLHRDIKPHNIYLRTKGPPVLLDFGAARQAAGEHSKPLTAIVTPGYGPVEQYSGEGEQGPWTDLYAFGGTLYRCMSGQVPAEATKRIAGIARGPDPLPPAAEVGKGRYSEMLLAAIDWMLALLPEDRPQSVGEVLPYFTESTAPEAPTALPETRSPAALRQQLLEKTRLRTGLREQLLQKTTVRTGPQEPRQRTKPSKPQTGERQRTAEPELKAKVTQPRKRKGVGLAWAALGAVLIVGAVFVWLQERTSPYDKEVAAKAKLARQISPLLTSAREQLDQGSLQGALRSVVSALEVDPTDPGAHELADEVLSGAQNEIAKAREHAERARAPELAPTAFEAARVKQIEADSFIDSGELKDAVQTLWAGAELFDLARQQAGRVASERQAGLEKQRQQTAQAKQQAELARQQRQRDAQAALKKQRQQKAQAKQQDELARQQRQRDAQARRQAERQAAPDTAVAKAKPPTPVRDPGEEIRRVISLYKRAYESLDANAVKRVWPSLTDQQVQQLAKAFAGYKSVSIDFKDCKFSVQGSSATVSCTVHQRVATKVGKPISESRGTTFRLKRGADTWLITGRN